MEVRLLGPAEVVVRGQPVPIAGPLVRRLVAALALHPGHPVPADTLAELLWPGDGPANPQSSLHKHIWTLRRTLRSAGVDAEAVVTTSADGRAYQLSIGEDDVDHAVFESLIAEARRASAAGRPDDAARLLDDGFSLWRGPAFAELADTDAGRAAAARLEESRLAAMEDRIDIDLARGDEADAISKVRLLVEEHPYRERLWAQLMLARYRTGRQADALRTYAEARERLRDDLGLEPGEELRQLERRILEQDPALSRNRDSAATPLAAIPGAYARTGNLPVPVTTFVGRDAEHTEVCQLLRSVRLVSLIGPGGVGKTRLAVEVASDAAAAYADGAWLVDLGRVERPEAVVHAVGDALGLRRRRAVDPVDGVVGSLVSRHLLLVLDTCEHVIEAAAAFLDALLQRCPRVTALATSRERLRVPGEHVFDLAPLAVTGAGAAGIGVTAPAVQLLVDRAVAAGRRQFTVEEIGHLSEVARRLDGLPLALELAAPRLRSMTPLELIAALERPLQQLTAGPRTVERRQQTLRATVEWSYRRLDRHQRAVFDRLSAFTGGATHDAAAAVCSSKEIRPANVAAAIGDLIDKSMLTAAPGVGGAETRFSMLDALRAYGRERLADEGTIDETRRHHARYFTEVAGTQMSRLAGPTEVVALAAVDSEFGNIRAAHAWALESGEHQAALRVPAMLRWWAQMQLRPEVFEWAERALALADDGADADDRAAAMATVATGAWMRGEFAAAAERCEQGLVLAGADRTRAHVLHNLGMMALFGGRLTECVATFTEAVALVTDSEPYAAAGWMTPIALSHAYQGETGQAMAAVDEQARRLDGLAQPANGMLIALHHYTRGEVLLETAPEEALVWLDRALAVCRSGVAPFVTGTALLSATSLRARHGDPRGAVGAFVEAIGHWSRVGEWPQQWTTMRNAVELLHRLGADREAAILLGAVNAANDAPPLFGAGAARLAAVADALAVHLGAAAYQAALDEGRRLVRRDIVTYTVDSLRAVERLDGSDRGAVGPDARPAR